MPGAFGQPNNQPVDLGMDIASGYQQNAQAKIAQAKVAQRKGYTSDYAGKYGVKDVTNAVKGKSDADIYQMATDLVNKRRGAAAKPAPAPAPKPTGQKLAPKATPKKKPATAPKVTARTKSRAKATAPKVTTKPRPRRPAVKPTQTLPVSIQLARAAQNRGALEY